MQKYLIMLRYLIIACFFLCANFTQAQKFKNDSIRLFLDKSFDLIQSNSISTENLGIIKKDIYQKSQKLSSIDEAAPLFKNVFKGLNDYHGSLKYKGKTYGWTKSSSYTNPYLKSKLKTETKVSSRVIDRKIGYIRIPGNNDFRFKKVDSIANDIVSHINAVDSEELKGWIIDLRVNTGGNMYPILLALKEFIGHDIIFGGFRNARNEPTGNWEIKAGNLLVDNNLLERKTNLDHPDKGNVPVVILTSGYTASAGEMTAVSFIGRKHTSIVGEPTANYTTAVQGFDIAESVGINLSTDYVVDRDQKSYKSSIIPDFEIKDGDNFENLENDLKVRKALELLKWNTDHSR